MEEIWKDIKDWKDYQVSNLGNVKRLNYRKTGKEKKIKQQKLKYGYLYITLNQNGKRKTFRVHRLVAQAFIPNPNNLPQVNHKDEDKTNNVVENLEWCDARHNSNYGTRNKRISEAHTGEKHHMYGKHHTEESKRKMSEKLKGVTRPKRRKAIFQLDKETNNIIKEWTGAKEAAKELGISQGHITNCCQGKRKTAYGFKWRYKKVG